MDKLILIIEDDEFVQDNINLILEEEGYQVIGAETGRKGIKLAENSQPDLIICDIMLPDINGYEIIQELKEDKNLSKIPFIFLSARAEMRDLREGMNLGADDYLTKPFRRDELLNAIKTRLRKYETFQAARKGNSDELKKNGRMKDDDYLFLKKKDDISPVYVKDIEYIEAEGSYSKVYLSNGKNVFVKKILKEWEELLPENNFVRVHRSIIINVKKVKKIEKWFNNSYRIWMQSFSEPITASRRYSSKFKRYFIT
jgi:DNA-binding LytR/AlgR family response regulator